MGDRPSAIRAPLGGTRKPRRRARPGPLLRPPAPRPALGLPGLGTSGREPKGSGAERSPPRPPRREHLPIHGPDGGAHTVRGLTGSPRAEGGGGGGRAAPGDGKEVPLRSPRRSEVGEWETGAETRDAPATAAPPPSPLRKRVPASLHPAPRRRRPPLAPPSAGLRFGSRAPSSGALPKTPPPGPSFPRARAARVSLPRSRERASAASPPLPPFRGLSWPSGFCTQGCLACTLSSAGGKNVGIQLRRVGRSVPRGPQNHGGIASGGRGYRWIGPQARRPGAGCRPRSPGPCISRKSMLGIPAGENSGCWESTLETALLHRFGWD